MKIDIPSYEEREEAGTQLVIHSWDTWNMDNTLALIIHPMLIQLKNTMHGYPSHLTEERWNEILDEMIWAFEQKTMDDWNDQYYGPFIPDEKEPLGGEFEWIDHDGLKAHQERMTKAFKLFGEYYENLWD